MMPHVVAGIKSDDVRLKGDALNLLHLTVDFHAGAALQPFVSDAVACALSALTADYHKLKAEALRVCGALCKALHRTETKNFTVLVSTLFQAVYEQLLKKDMDSEVKEAALATVALLIYYFADVLKVRRRCAGSEGAGAVLGWVVSDCTVVRCAAQIGTVLPCVIGAFG